ncbi:MAG: class I SAM-dependent methyltransferase, partial [Acidimicrobiales bacterium]
MTAPDHWFEELADHMGEAYLRYSFTKGTSNEVEFLVDALGLEPGMRLLDVGCGPGRHAIALAKAGMSVTGIDISQRFVDIANEAASSCGVDATFVRADARSLDYHESFDVAYSLCQGAFGILGGPTSAGATPSPVLLDPDLLVLRRMAAATRAGGKVVCSAFSAAYLLRNVEELEFDVDTGVHHESTEIRNEQGEERRVDLWTTCFTP